MSWSHSPANTSGGSRASSRATTSAWAWSGQVGCWETCRCCQLGQAGHRAERGARQRPGTSSRAGPRPGAAWRPWLLAVRRHDAGPGIGALVKITIPRYARPAGHGFLTVRLEKYAGYQPPVSMPGRPRARVESVRLVTSRPSMLARIAVPDTDSDRVCQLAGGEGARPWLSTMVVAGLELALRPRWCRRRYRPCGS